VIAVRPLFHIVDPTVWEAARAAGWYRPESLAAEGFVHCSFAEQVAPVANARYRDAGELCVVELDPTQVGEVRVEDSYGEGNVFPHVYGPLPTSAAVARHALTRDEHGDWTFSAGPAAGAASPDH
jgi:uncharacterized protein (DUF952 family)